MIFLNSASFAAVLVFDLPLCTQTDTEGKPRERQESGIYLKIFENTQYLIKTLYLENLYKLYQLTHRPSSQTSSHSTDGYHGS